MGSSFHPPQTKFADRMTSQLHTTKAPAASKSYKNSVVLEVMIGKRKKKHDQIVSVILNLSFLRQRNASEVKHYIQNNSLLVLL